MNPISSRPVVVNSLLCFLKNYREQSNILQIIDQHFTLESRRLSYQILLELLTEPDKLAVASSACTPSLLDLFDRVSQSETTPVFATDDLTVLPLSLNYEDGVEQPKDLYNEVRQLRLYVHNALEQKIHNSTSMWKRNNGQFEFGLPSQQQHSSVGKVRSPALPKTQSKQSNVNADRCDFNVSSLLKTDRSDLQCSPTSSSSSTSSELNSAIASPKSMQHRRLANRVRKQHTGNRLDKAVQKLTDRLLKTETNNNEEECNSGHSSFERKETVHENNNNTIAAFGSNAAAITAQIIQNFTSQAYENNKLLKASQLSVEHELNNDDNAETDRDALLDFGHDNEKTSSLSSPTPSDMSMGRDCGDTGNDSEKPYVCSEFNCQKRFSNKFLLKKHQFIHTGLRPHACPFCAKQFNRKDNLLRHKKTHLNNAIAQISGRRRHNALCGVTEEAANSFQMFQHQMNSLVEEPKEFQYESLDDIKRFSNLENKKQKVRLDDELIEDR